MITLLLDPDDRYVADEGYIHIDYTDLPKSYNKSTEIMKLLHSSTLDGSDRFIVIHGVDNLEGSKATMLVRILMNKPDTTKVLLTAKNENKISDHIHNLMPVVKKLKGKIYKKDKSLWQKLDGYYKTRSVPDDDDLFMLLRSVGDTMTVSQTNRELASEIDGMLFQTHSRYLAVAWAGLHEPQSVRVKVVSTKKKEKKPKKKPKIHPTKFKKRKNKTMKSKQTSLSDFL